MNTFVLKLENDSIEIQLCIYKMNDIRIFKNYQQFYIHIKSDCFLFKS